MKYRAEIDGLRALAVLPVILFHAGFEWFSGGFVGVDVFFVISGYLITTIIISEMAEGKFSIVNFYERRARRILPALFFVIIASFPLFYFSYYGNYFTEYVKSIAATATFTSNIFFWLNSNYFSLGSEIKPLLHTWSLAVEEQYYILFPIFLMFTWRLGIKWVLILLSIVFFISLGVAQLGAYNSPNAAFFLLPTRGWELLVGVFAAFYLKHNMYLKSLFLNQILSLLGLGMIVYSIIAFDESTPFPSLYALIPTIGTGLIILSSTKQTVVHSLLGSKVLVGLGLISYSAYLWHQPLLAALAFNMPFEERYFYKILVILITLALAYLSYKFIEGPFRNKYQISKQNIFIFAIVGSISLTLFGVVMSDKRITTTTTR
jgi:peptidoglycan/LPS O-acetylase OafA/YrhL